MEEHGQRAQTAQLVGQVAAVGTLFAPWLGVVALAANAYAGYEQSQALAAEGDAALAQSQYNASLKDWQAELIRKEAQAKADNIRERAMRVRSTQTAQSAASGAVIGVGSAQAVQDETTRLAEQDAIVALYQGVQDANFVNIEANNIRRSGENAYKAAQEKAQATLLSTGTKTVVGAVSLGVNAATSATDQNSRVEKANTSSGSLNSTQYQATANGSNFQTLLSSSFK